jgi:hypothetical protein
LRSSEEAREANDSGYHHAKRRDATDPEEVYEACACASARKLAGRGAGTDYAELANSLSRSSEVPIPR